MKNRVRNLPAPNWSVIFSANPELEAPGYQEAKQAVNDKKNRAEIEKIKAQMQEIQKDRASYKNKNRNRSRR